MTTRSLTPKTDSIGQLGRSKVATSHEGLYSYWLGERYIWQYDESKKKWQGWLCSLPVWERTFAKAGHFCLVSQPYAEAPSTT